MPEQTTIQDNPGFTEEQNKINKIKDEIKSQYKNIFFDNKPYFKELTSNSLIFLLFLGDQIHYNPIFNITTRNSPWNCMKLHYTNIGTSYSRHHGAKNNRVNPTKVRTDKVYEHVTQTGYPAEKDSNYKVNRSR